MTYGNVYLLHFAEKVHGKQHYVGFTTRKISARIHDHLTSEDGSAMITRSAQKHDVAVLLGFSWENVPVSFEAKLKREKNLKRHCTICRPPKARLVPQACPAMGGKPEA